MITKPKARRDLVARELPDSLAVLDFETDVLYMLNPAAAYILTLCEGTRTVNDLVAELCDTVPTLSREQAAADVARALRDMRELLEESSPRDGHLA